MNASREEIAATEDAAFASWPAIDGEGTYMGWRLRYGGGYTKRANSANSAAAAAMLSHAQIEEIERRYRKRGLQPIFRLVSATVPSGMDEALEQRGYVHMDHSLVMSLALTDGQAGELPSLVESPAEWLACFAQASGVAATNNNIHLRMLSQIRGRCAFAVENRSGKPECFALGVVVGQRLGLFDVVTPALSRRQGLATKLCTKLLAWGSEQGALTAYLQVVSTNAPAIALYDRMGFRNAYHYWYRVAA